MKRKGLPLNGWFVLDKPLGLSSTQALAKVRYLLNANKAGHGGTLDPEASGILPIALGEATKTVGYMMDATKRYRFTLCFGEQRNTDDVEGVVIATSPHRPTEAEILAILPRFIGTQSQMPPAFSALKINGERAYNLARAGEEVVLEPRLVQIDAIDFKGLSSPDHAIFEVTCGKGTYIRSLARDLALALGTVGYVAALRRLQVGRFDESVAISLEELAKKVHNTPTAELLQPIETALDDIPVVALSASEAQQLRLGQRVPLLHRPDWSSLAKDSILLALHAGKAVALGEIVAGEFRSVRVFNIT